MTVKILTPNREIIKMDLSSYLKYWNMGWGFHRPRGKPYLCKNTEINGVRKVHYLHRLITNCINGFVVDHINGDTLDNREDNLRVCSYAENSRNAALQKKSKTGYKGVRKVLGRKKNPYIVRIKVDRKQIYLGCYKSAEMAAEAYNEAAKKHFGEFSKLNEIRR